MRRLKGLTGRSARTRDVREIHGSLREIGQEILGATRQTGWRAEAARVATRAGRVRAALEGLWRRMEGLHRYERCFERWTRVHESSREIGQEIFGASRQTGGCGQLAAGPAAAVAAGVDWGLTVNEHNRAKGVLARRMRGDGELAARESYKIICYSSEDTCGKRLQANEKSVRWRRISSRSAGLLAFSSSSISSS